MGYECGFYKFPKCGLTDKEAYATATYAQFLIMLEGEWYQKQIAAGHTFEFDDSRERKDILKYVRKEPEILDKFIAFVRAHADKACVDYWCSIGHCFEEDVREHATPCFEAIDSLDQAQLVDLCMAEQMWLDNHELLPVSISRAFVEDENGDIKLMKCDGVEIQFDDGTIRRVYTNGEYDTSEVYGRAKYADYEEYMARKRLVDVLNKIIAETDFEETAVFFEYGW